MLSRDCRGTSPAARSFRKLEIRWLGALQLWTMEIFRSFDEIFMKQLCAAGDASDEQKKLNFNTSSLKHFAYSWPEGKTFTISSRSSTRAVNAVDFNCSMKSREFNQCLGKKAPVAIVIEFPFARWIKAPVVSPPVNVIRRKSFVLNWEMNEAVCSSVIDLQAIHCWMNGSPIRKPFTQSSQYFGILENRKVLSLPEIKLRVVNPFLLLPCKSMADLIQRRC